MGKVIKTGSSEDGSALKSKEQVSLTGQSAQASVFPRLEHGDFEEWVAKNGMEILERLLKEKAAALATEKEEGKSGE